MANLSEQDKLTQVLQHLDPRTTVLVCGKHNYSPGGPKMPESKCGDCWFAFLFHHLSQLPPSKQQERLDQLEVILNLACEEEDAGKFDFKPYRHARISIEKGAEN